MLEPRRDPASGIAGLSLDTLVLGLVLLVVAVVYGTTMCPTVYWYDSAEFSAHAVSLGVPHPPGYPAYTLMAHVFTWLPGEAARGVNLMSLVFGLVSVAILYRLARGMALGPAAAAVGASTLALLPSVWGNAVVAEVYTPGLAFTLGTFLLLQQGIAREQPRRMLAAALLAGIGVGVHMSIATLGLGYAFLVLSYGVRLSRTRDLLRLWSRPWGTRLKLGAGSLVAVVLGLGVFLYIPLRRFERWDLREWIGFFKNATGGRFKGKLMKRYDPIERAELVLGIVVDNLQWIGLALAVVGLVALCFRRPRFGVALLLGAIGNVWWFFNYNVPDLDVFLIPTLAIAALLLGAGVEAVVGLAARGWAKASRAAVLGLAFPLWLLVQHYAALDMSRATTAREYGELACDQLSPGSTLIHYSRAAEWERYAVILYMQKARGRCEGVTIVKRPRQVFLKQKVEGGRPVYGFLHRRLTGFEFRPEGVLFRIRRR